MKLKKSLFYIIVYMLLSISMTGCGSDDGQKNLDFSDEEKITVAVSIVPQEAFVKAVSGDLINIVTMIPPGNSPANYQPTPKEMTNLSESKIYFSIGVPTEKANILDKADEFNKDIKIVALDKIVGEEYPDRYFGEEDEHDHDEELERDVHEDGRDPHIWLSPKRVIVMIEAIKDELIEIDRDNKDIYEKNAEIYISKLVEVDKEIEAKLKGIDQKSFIIYHPTFGYFADDYGLKMITIEKDGKETTAKNLQNVIDFAKNENIKYVFYQEEFDSKQAETVAKEINGETIKVSPLSINYIENLRIITGKF